MPLAVITGASTGIGRACALRLATEGWTVLAGVRSEQDGERLAALAPGGGVHPLQLDVTDPAQRAAAAERVAAEAGASARGGLDALVNNAGIGLGGPLEVLPESELRRQFDVNFFGHVAVTQELLPALRRARGRLVFVSSIGGRVALAFNAPYAASKHAIEAVGDSLRVELQRSHVQVALLEPGSVATPIWEKSRGEAVGLEIPPELEGAYGGVPEAIDRTLRSTGERGIPPEQVAETLLHALRARHMRARYVIGRDARAMLAAKRLLPDRVFDRLSRRALGV